MGSHCCTRKRDIYCGTRSEGTKLNRMTHPEPYSLLLLAGIVAECQKAGRIGDPLQIGAVIAEEQI